jgi:hypothetical protein
MKAERPMRNEEWRGPKIGKLQIPNTKLQRSSKSQTSTRCPGWRGHRSVLGLELEIWSFFGAWCLGLGALGYDIFHPKQQGTVPMNQSHAAGARPSSGAATLARTVALDASKAFLTRKAAAPEDGRTPFGGCYA